MVFLCCKVYQVCRVVCFFGLIVYPSLIPPWSPLSFGRRRKKQERKKVKHPGLKETVDSRLATRELIVPGIK